MLEPRVIIPKRVAQEFKDGDLVNLGVGIPTLVPAYIPENIKVWLHAENGIVGVGPQAKEGEIDPYLVDASKKFATLSKGGVFVDSATSFGIIRGGHLAATVLGALQVDQYGNLANWIIPGAKINGMGGAMDLVAGAKRVIVATEHCAKNGESKIKKICTFPLTGEKVVSLIVTELAVMRPSEKGLVLMEVAPGVTVDVVKSKTEADLIIDGDVKVMNV